MASSLSHFFLFFACAFAKQGFYCAEDADGIRSFDWFHLQGVTTFGKQMDEIGRSWDTAVSRLRRIFPTSRFGAAFYESPEMPYKLVSLLSDEDSQLKAIRESFKGHNGESEDFAESETDIPSNYTGFDPNDSHPMRTSLEAIFWTASRANWRKDKDIFRMITLFDRLAPARAGLPDLWDRKKLGPFTVDTYPKTTPEFWPDPKVQPRISSESDFVAVPLVRQALTDSDVYLFLQYGAFPTFSTSDEWRHIMGELWEDYEKVQVDFVSGAFAKGGDELIDAWLRQPEVRLQCLMRRESVTRNLRKIGKINYFHLQERRGFSMMLADIRTNWPYFAEDLLDLYPESKFGAAFFGHAMDSHYLRISDLVGDWRGIWRIARNMVTAYNKDPAIDFRTTEQRNPRWRLLYTIRERDLLPTAPMEPIIWTILHSSWDKGDDVLKIITISTAQLPHHANDQSPADINRSQFKPFTLDTYPAGSNLWPASVTTPLLSRETAYAPISLAKTLLDQHNVYLAVVINTDWDYTPVETWKVVLRELGINYQRYMRESLRVPRQYVFLDWASHLRQMIDHARIDFEWRK